MIFILEGPDGVGKTTLGQHMAKQLGAVYLHLSYRWPKHMIEYHTAAIRWAIRKSHKQPVIIDRWWPSEAMYAAEYRGGSNWPHMGRMLDRIARKHGAMYIYCLPEDLAAHRDRFAKLREEREEMYDNIIGVTSRYLALWRGYAEHPETENYADMLTRTGGLYSRKDHVKYTIESWGNKLELFTDYVKARAIDLRNSQLPAALEHDNFLGHIKQAQYLMVGGQSHTTHRNLSWPWYEYTSTNLQIAQLLNQVPAHEELFVWAEAFNHDGSRNPVIAQALEHKPELKVVAIGKAALNHVNKLGATIHEHIVLNQSEMTVQRFRGVLRHAIH